MSDIETTEEQPYYDYKPECWLCIKIVSEQHGTYYKLLGSWSGGYTQGSTWKLNSGIKKITETDNCWFVHGYSGSVYQCNKGTERVALAMQPALGKLLDAGATIVPIEEVIESLRTCQ